MQTDRGFDRVGQKLGKRSRLYRKNKVFHPLKIEMEDFVGPDVECTTNNQLEIIAETQALKALKFTRQV
jgi:hypothetical protein